MRVAAAPVLADTPQAGPLGFLVVILLGVALAVLGRSLIKHLGRVPASFEQPSTGTPATRPSDGPVRAEPARTADEPPPAPDGDRPPP